MSEARERLAAAQEGRRQRGLHPKGTDQTYEEQTRVLMTWTKAELVQSLIREESDKLKAIDQLIDARTPQAVSLPDRADLREVLATVLSRVAFSGSGEEIGTEQFAVLVNDAIDATLPVLAALSTQPAAGATDELPEADATPDEAFELGRVSGYDEAMREVAQPAAGEVEEIPDDLSYEEQYGERA